MHSSNASRKHALGRGSNRFPLSKIDLWPTGLDPVISCRGALLRPASRARRREVQTRKVPDRRNLGLSTTTPTHTTAAGTMAASLARLPVAESRLRRALSGRLRRLSRGPLRGGSGRVQRRAVGLRGLVYFVGTHTRSTVPRGRSAAALGADATVAQILVPWHGTNVEKGLRFS